MVIFSSRLPGRSKDRLPLLFLSLFLLSGILLPGCLGMGGSSNNQFVHPQMDLAALQRVGVLPFQNFTPSGLVGEKITSMFCTELASTQTFEVVDLGVIQSFLRNNNLRPGALTKGQLKKFYNAYKIDALMLGSVDEYEMVNIRGKQLPVVTITARLVDTQTGGLLWMATRTVSGQSKTPIIDVGEIHILPRVARKACRKLLKVFRSSGVAPATQTPASKESPKTPAGGKAAPQKKGKK